MKLPHRRQFLHLAAGAAALPAVSIVARAQSYPTRPVRIIVGFAPGGPADLIARLIGQSLSERLGQQFIIENRPGAGSNIATEAVVRAPPDGYTLLLVTATNAINTTLYEKLNFDFVRDIVPVASVNRSSGVMEVNPLVPAKSVPEFIAKAGLRFRSAEVSCRRAILLVPAGRSPNRFRTIQVCPKDWPVRLLQVECAEVPSLGDVSPDFVPLRVLVLFRPCPH